ncbi:MAG: ankyrin repeat domain-containing protein [Bacteroidota bacterium]
MFLFLLKASLIVVILLAFYKLFLEKESFFAVNRIYLLGCLMVAVALPFVSLPKLIENQGYLTQIMQKKQVEETLDFTPSEVETEISEIAPVTRKSDENESKIESSSEEENWTSTSTEVEINVQASTDEKVAENLIEPTNNRTFNLTDWLFWIYLFGVGILLLNLIAQIISTLFKAIRNEDRIADAEGTIINLESESEPCSFFKYIFIHPDSYDFETYEQIIAHEKVHVKQWHSLDLMLAEIAVIFFWFNPFVWLFRKEVEKNIEYQTDDLLTQKAFKQEKRGYQLNLLKIATHNKPLTITTNYNQSLIKQRILKMNAKKSNPYSYWKYSFVAPVLMMLVLAMNEPLLASREISTTSNELSLAQEEMKTFSQEATTEKDNFAQLMQAIKDNDLEAVKTHLDKEIDLNRKDKDGFTPLLLAAYKKHDLIAQIIVAHTAKEVDFQLNIEDKSEERNFNDISPGDFELFMRAVDDGDIELVKYFLDKGGIDLNGMDEHQFTPLMLAASEDHPEIIDLLYRHGAKVNFMNRNGWTALIEAADEGSYASAVALLAFGADVDVFEKEGGRSAIVMAASEGHLAILKLLLSADVDFSKYHDGYTPLHGAAEEGHLSIVEILLEKIDVNFTDHYRRTALSYAAEEGHFDIVKYLIAQGADINIAQRSGRTPLSYAAEERQAEIVQFLLDKGADASIKDEEDFTALDYAIDEAAVEVVNILAKTDAGEAIIKANNSMLMEAIEEGSIRTIESLLDAGADINGSNRNGWTPLIEAADEGNLRIVEFLVSRGANVNAASNIGWTPLMEAVDEKSLNVVRYLIQKGANVNTATKGEFREGVGGGNYYIVHQGWTPLFEAIDEDAVASAELLFKQGADVNASLSRTLISRENGTNVRYENWTLLMDAVERERIEMIQFLLKNGADEKVKNSLGETALDVAKRTGNQMVVKLVKKKF